MCVAVASRDAAIAVYLPVYGFTAFSPLKIPVERENIFPEVVALPNLIPYKDADTFTLRLFISQCLL